MALPTLPSSLRDSVRFRIEILRDSVSQLGQVLGFTPLVKTSSLFLVFLSFFFVFILLSSMDNKLS
jgi:hypothetical protein